MKACELCGEPLDPHAYGVSQKCVGYAKRRGAVGGVNQVKDREWLDAFVHDGCIVRKKQGHRFGQRALGGM